LEIVLNIERGGTTTVLAVGAAVAVTFLLWRAYFIYVMPAGLPSTLNRLRGWTAAHLVVVVGIGLTSASIAAEAVNLPPELLEHMKAFTAAVGAYQSGHAISDHDLWIFESSEDSTGWAP
jgi:low temperature requirement protein LtrA